MESIALFLFPVKRGYLCLRHPVLHTLDELKEIFVDNHIINVTVEEYV